MVHGLGRSDPQRRRCNPTRSARTCSTCISYRRFELGVLRECLAPPTATPTGMLSDGAGGKRAVGEVQREAHRVRGEIVEGLLAAPRARRQLGGAS